MRLAWAVWCRKDSASSSTWDGGSQRRTDLSVSVCPGVPLSSSVEQGQSFKHMEVLWHNETSVCRKGRDRTLHVI